MTWHTSVFLGSILPFRTDALFARSIRCGGMGVTLWIFFGMSTFLGGKRAFWDKHSLSGREHFLHEACLLGRTYFRGQADLSVWVRFLYLLGRAYRSWWAHFWYRCIMMRAYLFSPAGTSISFGSFCVGRACLLGLAHVLARAYTFLTSILFRGVDFETRGSFGTSVLFGTNTFWDEAQGRWRKGGIWRKTKGDKIEPRQSKGTSSKQLSQLRPQTGAN